MAHPIGITQWLRRLWFWPMAMAVLLLWLLHSGSQIHQQLKAEQAQADAIGRLLAAVVGQGGALEELQQGQQLQQLLELSTLKQVRFLSLNSPAIKAPEQRPTLWQSLQEDRDSYRYIPIYAQRDDRLHTAPVGYLELSLELRSLLQQLIGDRLWELALLLSFLLLFWVGAGAWVRRQTGELRQLTQLSQQIREGQPATTTLQPLRVREFQRIDTNLHELQGQLEHYRQVQQLQQRQLQQQEQRIVQLGQESQRFRSMINHELKTPLNAIWGGIQLLQHDALLTTPQKDHLNLIAHGTQTLGRFLDQILLMVQLEQGPQSTRLHPVYPLELLEQAVRHVRRRIPAQQALAVRLQAEHDNLRLLTDGQQVSAIVEELLNNALNFTPQGEIVVRSGLSERAGQLYWRIEVQDSGVGMDADTLAQCTRPFFQGDPPGVSASAGRLGVGLSLVQQRLEILQGQLQLTSQPGQGSCVTVELPVQRAVDAAIVASGGRYILACNTITQWPLQEIVQAEGLRIQFFVGPDDALRLAAAEQPDLVVFQYRPHDEQMAGVIAVMRQRWSGAYLNVAMVVPQLSAHAQQQLMVDGVDWLIPMHWDTAQLLQQLRYWLR